jgi:hypothetical protein
MRCLYVDLDGTLLGRDASLFRDGAGDFTLLGARALEACHRAGIEVVPYSGRRYTTLSEDARLLGASSFIFEIGCGLSVDGETEWLTGDIVPGERTIFEQIADTGAPDLLLERFAGRLEHHDPWHRDRDVTHLFRGLLGDGEAEAVLAEHGLEHLRLVDNGTVRTRSPALADLPRIRAYHLLPRPASKARAVARHMQIRGYAPEECLAVGDSREDMDAADVVGTFWLVANALERDPEVGEAAAGRPNVRVTEAGHGDGVYEAVLTTLAESRG